VILLGTSCARTCIHVPVATHFLFRGEGLPPVLASVLAPARALASAPAPKATVPPPPAASAEIPERVFVVAPWESEVAGDLEGFLFGGVYQICTPSTHIPNLWFYLFAFLLQRLMLKLSLFDILCLLLSQCGCRDASTAVSRNDIRILIASRGGGGEHAKFCLRKGCNSGMFYLDHRIHGVWP